MANKEKVIKGLEHEIARTNLTDLEWLDCVEVGLLRDALALLKEQEQKCRECGEATSKAIQELQTKLKAREPIEARLNLCESCTKEYPECDATIDAMEFGRGVGNDNIIGCTAYVNRWKAQEPETSDVPKSDSNVGCWYDITHNYTLEQVVSALKSQGPRVLTLEEVIESEVGAVVWLEDIDKPTVIAGLVYRVFTGMMVVDFQCVARTVTAGFYDYGKRWRCWTSRPDEKTRAETPWE